MKILIVSHAFPPLMTVGGMRAYSWAKYWSELGAKVTVLTSSERAVSSYTSQFKIDILPNIEILEMKNPLFTKFGSGEVKTKALIETSRKKYTNKITRFIKNRLPVIDYYFDWVYYSKKYIRNNKERFKGFDFVISTANPLSAHSIAKYISKKNDIKWISDFRDMNNQEIEVVELSKQRKKIMEKFYFETLRDSDLSITVSKGLRGLLLQLNAKSNIEIIYNGYFEENYKLEKIEPIWNIVYTGTFYTDKFDISPLFRVLEKLSHEIETPNIDFYGIGKKAEDFLEIKSLKYTCLHNKINFYDSVSNEEIARVQEKAGVLLFLNAREERGVLKTKSFEYMATNRPIIALTDKKSEIAVDIFNKVEGYYTGFDEEELFEFIKKTHNNLSSKLINVDQVEIYSRKNQAIKLLEIIKRI